MAPKTTPSKGVKSPKTKSPKVATPKAVVAPVVVKDVLIDDKVSTAQVDKAVVALLTFAAKKAAEREETSLLDKEEFVWLQIATKKMNAEKKIMPAKM